MSGVHLGLLTERLRLTEGGNVEQPVCVADSLCVVEVSRKGKFIGFTDSSCKVITVGNAVPLGYRQGPLALDILLVACVGESLDGQFVVTEVDGS